MIRIKRLALIILCELSFFMIAIILVNGLFYNPICQWYIGMPIVIVCLIYLISVSYANSYKYIHKQILKRKLDSIIAIREKREREREMMIPVEIGVED